MPSLHSSSDQTRPAGELRAPPAARAPYSVRTDGTTLRLGRIASLAVKLAAHGPRLAALAGEANEQARRQAVNAAATAELMAGVSGDLARSVAELRATSGEVATALETVARIAEQTRLLSVNATIEAARSGERGRAFAIVADEVQRLADHTGEATRLIEKRLCDMRENLGRVETTIGHRPGAEDTFATSDNRAANGGAPNETARHLGGLHVQVEKMTDGAGQQLSQALRLSAYGKEVNAWSELLLLAIGGFRFEAHARAEAAVRALVLALPKHTRDRAATEEALIRWLSEHDYFELAYVTDMHGRQVIDNIGWREGSVARDPAAFGRDWSQRPWFRDAVARDSIGCTDIYRSAATGDFCFTVAGPIRGDNGEPLGVFGGDVNFQRLIEQ
jgi:hypothetical protein